MCVRERERDRNTNIEREERKSGNRRESIKRKERDVEGGRKLRGRPRQRRRKVLQCPLED